MGWAQYQFGGMIPDFILRLQSLRAFYVVKNFCDYIYQKENGQIGVKLGLVFCVWDWGPPLWMWGLFCYLQLEQ